MKSIMTQLAEKRRSIYSLGDEKILSNEEIMALIEQAVKYCPSAFNSQSARVVVLFNEHYAKFWEIVLQELRKITPVDKFYATELKIKSFASGLGTILFFEDEETVESLQKQFVLYKDKFPQWAEQANGMLQYLIWSALAEQNIGASLQHYNPIVDAKVHEEWKIASKWRLIAQMPFGSIKAFADEKTFLPLEQRIKIFL